jgi:aspartokinase-like uncharacterized kinase
MTGDWPATRVVKVGGSLLQHPWLPERLRHFVTGSPQFGHLLVVGGGTLVDEVRNWYRMHQLDQAFCHWLSIRLMSETARLLAELCPWLPLYCSMDAVPRGAHGILDCQRFMQGHSRLTADWRTTSDSIAAEVAEAIGAAELWLLKSALPGSPRIVDWPRQAFVDEHFVQTAGVVRPVHVLNLADPDLLSVRGI